MGKQRTFRGSGDAHKVAVPFRISVHGPDGSPYKMDAEVTLVAGDMKSVFQRVPHTSLYKGSVSPGTYVLHVRSGDLIAPERSIQVSVEGKSTSAYLGERDWPVYHCGENIVPFKPREDLIAVCFEVRAPDPERSRARIDEIVETLKLSPYELTVEGAQYPCMAANGAIWVFALPADADRAKVEDVLRRMLGADARIGMPIELSRGRVTVLDRQFIIRFRDHLKPADIESLAQKATARIVRGFIQAGNARLIAFQGGSYQDHLRIVQEWYHQDLLVYGEPDLVAEYVDDAFPADPPGDPRFGAQHNLTLQNVGDAWQFLNSIDPNLTLGSPAVYVATLDCGVQPDHPDIGGNLSDGTPQIAQCYDLGGLRPCTDPGYSPDKSHGMAVCGIIFARTDNAHAISGIAPNTHHIGIKRPDLLSANYADALLWAAGFATGNPTAGWPLEPISPGADIISCSHGRDGLCLTGLMDDTLTFLSVYGRGGKGTLVIYSAGNADDGPGQQITGYRVWAAHARTMAISNSRQPDAGGVERLDAESNFGPEIDICAQGTGTRTLNHEGGERTLGGTSAATPQVAATAALMLSVNPDLTWIDLRDLLRDTAVLIDGANADPVGQWMSGFSWWYGFGRLDVCAAVQAAYEFDPGTVNLVVRDNLDDTGTFVPTTGTFWRSPDVWIRNDDPATDPIGNPKYESSPPNQPAVAGATNWVRVRVRNFGTASSANFYVRVYLTHFAGSQFVYPSDFIPSTNTGDPIPSPLVQATYLIGEQMVSTLCAGTHMILDFPWPSALAPPEFVAGTKWQPCILAEVSPHTGPGPSGNLVVGNSNLAQRNMSVIYVDDDGAAYEVTGVIGNAANNSPVRRIVVHRGNLPKHAKIWVRFPDPQVENAVVRSWSSATSSTLSAGDTGCSPGRTSAAQQSEPIAETVDGHRRFRLKSGSRLTLDVPMDGGALTPVVVGAQLRKGSLAGSYEIPLIEHGLHDRILGGFSMVIARR